ncbi:hypothetical protein C8Q75DRAFT_782194 [Abortiporus biennis]|nr:hypothetical protein C8Q75DRAFT_782194 [Abortiporus biennis]
MSDEATEIIDFSWSKFFTTASTVSIASVAVYDYLLTFDQENQHIWRRRFNLSSTVFVVNRYTIIFSILGNVAFGFISGTHSSCLGLWFSISVSATVSEIASLIFFVVRIWAIWGQHFLPLLILTPLAICLIVINAVLNFPVTYAGIIHLQYPYGGCVILPTLSDNVSNRLQDTGSALGILFSSLLLCATLMKTLALKRVADRAGLKGSLISLLIRDGTTYLCLTIILNIIQAIISQSNVESKAPGVLALGGLVVRLRPIIVSHMILDLKSIDQIFMASLPEVHSSRFSSIDFVGNIGAPLDAPSMDANDGEETVATITLVSAKQIIEDPLSIGLLDEEYGDSTAERIPTPASAA